MILATYANCSILDFQLFHAVYGALQGPIKVLKEIIKKKHLLYQDRYGRKSKNSMLDST